MSEPKYDYDYDGYTKSLEKIYEGVSKDYWSSYIDINRHQVSVGKLYLWVSVTLLGVYSIIFERHHEFLLTNNYIVILVIISFLCSGLAFAICLYAIPARKGYKTIPSSKGWGEFSHEIRQYLDDNNPKIYATFLTYHISKFDFAWAYNLKTNQTRAVLLRITSWLLISSFAFAIIIGFYASIKLFLI